MSGKVTRGARAQMSGEDRRHMSRALALARRAYGRTSPNPHVGAVVVKAGRVIAEGYHRRAGMPHAEAEALKRAGIGARGATLYVTLEPCAHYGRTPPCVEQVIASGVARVVIALRDPNPLTDGRSIRLLRKRGIRVKVGVCRQEARKINRAFIKYISSGLPYVTVKTAQSLDGKTATRTGRSRWITGPRARALAHRRRSEFDAVLVGIGTVLADDPRLEATGGRQPVKVVVDTRLRTPASARLFNKGTRVVILTASANNKRYPSGTTVVHIPRSGRGLDLHQGLKRLGGMGIASLLIEGGSTITGALFDAKLVDALCCYISPKVIGGKEALSSVTGRGVSDLGDAARLRDVKVSRVGEDLLVEAEVYRKK